MDMAVSAQVCIGRSGATRGIMTIRNSDTSDLVPSQHSKVVIVTVGARGLGRACVERFLNDGATVVAVDIDEAGLADCASKSDIRQSACARSSQTSANALISSVARRNPKVRVDLGDCPETTRSMQRAFR